MEQECDMGPCLVPDNKEYVLAKTAVRSATVTFRMRSDVKRKQIVKVTEVKMQKDGAIVLKEAIKNLIDFNRKKGIGRKKVKWNNIKKKVKWIKRGSKGKRGRPGKRRRFNGGRKRRIQKAN